MPKELILKEFKNVSNAVELLQASIKKFKTFVPTYSYTPQELEYYDSLSFRFEKVIELTLNFYKGLELFLYSKTSDTLRNRLLTMQKINLIDDVEFWMEARILRNKISHTYEDYKLQGLYDEIRDKGNKIFTYLEKIEKYLKDLS